MRLSDSIRKNVLSTNVGSIISELKGPSRRYILFPEEILAKYIQLSENLGHHDEIKEVASIWTILVTNSAPNIIKKLPITIFFNLFLKSIWINIGGIDDLHATRKGNILHIATRGEMITRNIGKNVFFTEILKSIIETICRCNTLLVTKSQSKKSCEYSFRLAERVKRQIPSKHATLYNRLNTTQHLDGLNLKTLLKNNVFRLDANNRLIYRGKVFVLIENTLFHLLSKTSMNKSHLPEIAANFFRDILHPNTALKSGLPMLKNLLQITGWGITNIKLDENRLTLVMKNVPFGLHVDDDWKFISNTILGYLKIFKECEISGMDVKNRILRIEYKFKTK